MSDQRGIYVAIFSLQPTADRAVLLDHLSSARKWLEAQPEFVALEVYESDVAWSLRLIGTTQPALEQLLANFLATPLFGKLIGLFKPEFYRFLGRPLAL